MASENYWLRRRREVLREIIDVLHQDLAATERAAEALKGLVERDLLPDLNPETIDRQELESEFHEAQATAATLRGQLNEVQAELADVERQLDVAPPPVPDALALQPPAHLVATEDIAALAADLEPLLVLADHFVDDDTKPPDIRAAVETRARTLRGELRLFGDEPHDAIIITRCAAYLIATLTPHVIEDAGDDLPDESKAALDAVAEGASELGDDDTAVEGATTIAGALDPPEASQPDTDQPYRDAARRGLANWIENDLFKIHLNRIVTAGITTAGGVGVEASTGGVSAILRAGRAVLRARFPWIFA